MVLEEFAEELRKRPGRGGKALSENTVHKYLDAVSAVLQDAAKNDILLYNPAHRVEKVRVENLSSVFRNNGRCESSCSAFCRSRCFIECIT